jgi:hypothetical protein
MWQTLQEAAMGKPWFRTKRYGYGAGLPCSWEGWATLAGFGGAIFGLSALPETITQAHPSLPLGIGGLLIFGFVALVWRKSDKPWSWRWGGD